MDSRLRRQCLHTLCPGTFPSCAWRYSVVFPTCRYFASSSMFCIRACSFSGHRLLIAGRCYQLTPSRVNWREAHGADYPLRGGLTAPEESEQQSLRGNGVSESVVTQTGRAELPRFRRLRHPSRCGAKGLSASRGSPRWAMDDDVGASLAVTSNGQRRPYDSHTRQGEHILRTRIHSQNRHQCQVGLTCASQEHLEVRR